ncbi:MAG: hypothetical protein ABI288_03245 [Ginsengibacter sp.]
MSKTDRDWAFSTFVHHSLAIPYIYESLGWEVISIREKEAMELDLNHGIDYILADNQRPRITVQERFRDNFYGDKYNDATLRFRRESNPDPNRVKSEFYKIKADYLVYGICNGSKASDKRHTLTGFIKWIVLDLKFIREKFNNGFIKIITGSGKRTCWIENKILHCPENFNPDGSSSFLPLDIMLIHSLWGQTPIIVQKGFL